MINVNLLREKVISAAVLGKLSANYISKTSAKDDLVKLGIKIDELSDENTPCAIKTGWEWVRVSNLGADKYAFADGPFGSNLKREHYTDEKQVRIIQLSNVGELGWKNENEKYTTYEHLETIKRSEVFPGNIVIAKMMPAGRAIIVPDVSDAYVLSSDCVRFVPNSGLNTKYLCYAINSKMFRTQVLQDVHGIGRERTSLSKLKSYLLPIPPIDEQQVIVDRIDYIYDLINQIDALQQQYESDREVLENKIIMAGIQGRLTDQKSEDGSIHELYQKLKEEKERLVKQKIISKEKPIQEVSNKEAPYPIPDNWKWVRFSDLYSLSNGVASRGSEGGKPHPVLRLADLTSGEIDIENVRSIELTDSEFNSHKIHKGDLVFIRVNGSRDKVANAFLYSGEEEISYCDHLFCGHKISDLFEPEYVMLVYYSSMVKKQIDPEIKTTAGQNTINQKSMSKIMIPLPPTAEQRRIVDKVNMLLLSMPE